MYMYIIICSYNITLILQAYTVDVQVHCTLQVQDFSVNKIYIVQVYVHTDIHTNVFSLHVTNTNRSSLDKTLKAQRHRYTTQTIAHFRGELGIVQSQCRCLLPHLLQLLFQDLDVLCLLFPVVGKLLRYLFELLGCFTLALPRIASSPGRVGLNRHALSARCASRSGGFPRKRRALS